MFTFGDGCIYCTSTLHKCVAQIRQEAKNVAAAEAEK